MVAIDEIDALFSEDFAYVEVLSRTSLGRHSSLYFANHRPNAYTSNPILLSRSPIIGWRALRFDGSPFQNHGWVYVGRSIDESELLAIVDYIIEGPGSHLTILRSNDEGRTWIRGAEIEKPYHWSHLHEVRIQSCGSGTVSVCLHDGNHPELEGGYYIYTTNNGGNNWSGPEFSPRLETEIRELALCNNHPRISSRNELKSLYAR